MRPLATTVTAAALIVHALLGCCWHHAHAEATGGVTSLATIKPVVHGNHVHFHASPQDAQESTPSDHQHDQQGCDDNACSYLAANRTSDVGNSSAVTCQGASVYLACFTPTGGSQRQDSLAAYRRPPHFAAGHCALYLSLQTLRI